MNQSSQYTSTNAPHLHNIPIQLNTQSKLGGAGQVGGHLTQTNFKKINSTNPLRDSGVMNINPGTAGTSRQ